MNQPAITYQTKEGITEVERILKKRLSKSKR
jgi:hypothetical protein